MTYEELGNPDTLKEVQDSAQLQIAIQKLLEGALYTQKQAVTEAMQALVTSVHSNVQNVQVSIAAAQSAVSSSVITPAHPHAGSFQDCTMDACRVEGCHLGVIPDPVADITEIWLFILRPPLTIDEDDSTSTNQAVHLFLPDDTLSLIGFDDTYPDMQLQKTKVCDAGPPSPHFKALQLACILPVLFFT